MVVTVELEDIVGNEAYDQTDEKLQNEGLRCAGHIGGGQIADGHTDRTGKSAPETADQKCRENAEYISEMEGCLLGAHGDIDFKEGKADVAKRGEQSRLREAFDACLGCRRGCKQGIVQSLQGEQDAEEHQSEAVRVGTLQ